MTIAVTTAVNGGQWLGRMGIFEGAGTVRCVTLRVREDTTSTRVRMRSFHETTECNNSDVILNTSSSDAAAPSHSHLPILSIKNWSPIMLRKRKRKETVSYGTN